MGENGQPAIEIRGLRKRYGETKALVRLDLECERGKVRSVLGENGSGKSTMVKILSGIIAPDGGDVLIGGAPITTFEPVAMRSRGVAAVYQEVLVAPNRSVLENVFLGYDGLFLRKIGRRERRELAAATIARISNTSIDLDRLVGTLPLPQRQLVVIARALVRDPNVLILDEATSALDIGDRQTLFAAIQAFVAEGRSVIYISHRVDEVLHLSDDVTILRAGETVTTIPRSDLSAARLLEVMLPPSLSEECINA